MPQKGFSKAWLLVVVAVVIAAGVLLWWQLQVPAEKPASGEAETQGEAEQSAADETADWKTYRNEEYGFEIKYPKDWQYSTSSTYFVFASGAVNAIGRGDNYCRIGIALQGEDYYQKEPQIFLEKGYQEAGKNIYGLGEISLTSPKECKFIDELIYFSRGDNRFRITRECGDVDRGDECKKIFNQMLSFFRFLEGENEAVEKLELPTQQVEPVVPTDWQTYTAKLGYKVSFPNDFSFNRTVLSDEREMIELQSDRPSVKYSSIFIDIQKCSAGITPRIWVNWFRQDALASNVYKDVVINDINAIEKQSYDNLTGEHLGGEFIMVKGQRALRFQYTVVKTDTYDYDEIVKVVNQILSTLRFVE